MVFVRCDTVKKLSILLFTFGLLSVDGQAYLENYPPFPFGQNNFSSLAVQPVITHMEKQKTVQLGKIEIEKVSTESFNYSIGIYYEGRLLASLNEAHEWPFFIGDIFYVDVDKNGFNDIIIYVNQSGVGLGGIWDDIFIFLQIDDGKFRKIHYNTYRSDIADFIDVNGDGRFELLITEIAGLDSLDGKTHSYWFYNLYKIEDFNLVMANELDSRFPKVIWFTHKPNDKETEKLSSKQKEAFIKSLPREIISAEV